MLNEEKIRLMTKLAAFEKREGKDMLRTGEFFRGDYVSRQILLSEMHYTLCFLLVVMVGLLMRLESILLNLSLQYIHSMLLLLGSAYAIGFLITGVISGIEARLHYSTSQALREFYTEKLEQLLGIVRNERIPENELRYGDDFSEEIRMIRAGILPEEEEEEEQEPGKQDKSEDDYPEEAREAVLFAREEASRYLREEKLRREREMQAAQGDEAEPVEPEPQGGWLDDPIDENAEDYWLDDEVPAEAEASMARENVTSRRKQKKNRSMRRQRQKPVETEWLDEDWEEGDEE